MLMLSPTLRRLLAASVFALGAVFCAELHAATPKPAIHISLDDLGIPPVPQAIQASGAVMVTAHFVDSTHLLVTYGLRGLVERIPDDPPEHNDRAVAALLVELPSGKVLARARWHLHDYNRYLWPLGNGRFLMRSEARLVTIAPMLNLASGDAFHQMPFIRAQGLIEAILVSPEGELVTVETSPIRRRLPKPGAAAAAPAPADDDTDRPRGPIDISFYRLNGEGTVEDPLVAVSSGAIKSPNAGLIPINGRGILSARSRRRDTWTAQFNSFGGVTSKLSDIPSSCPPLLQPLGFSNYLVFTCRGAADRIQLSEYNFLLHEMWEEPLPGTQPFGAFAFSPAAGRFAMSRLITLSSGSGNAPAVALGADTGFSTSQDVRVYQAESGDLLLKLTPTPTSPTSQNFDLSSDGMSALVLNAGFIDIYRLPPLTKQDTEDLAALKPAEPAAPLSLYVNVRQTLRRAAEDSIEPEPAVVGEPQTGMTVATVLPPALTQTTIANGDAQTPRRKPPSLLNPGEKAEFTEKKNKSDPAKE